jgi:hypothetical protein
MWSKPSELADVDSMRVRVAWDMFTVCLGVGVGVGVGVDMKGQHDKSLTENGEEPQKHDEKRNLQEREYTFALSVLKSLYQAPLEDPDAEIEIVKVLARMYS